jgi:hypothetical protein
MAYSCDRCGAAQYGCNCWELNAAKFVASAAQGQDRLDELRRAKRDNPPSRGRSGGSSRRGRAGK